MTSINPSSGRPAAGQSVTAFGAQKVQGSTTQVTSTGEVVTVDSVSSGGPISQTPAVDPENPAIPFLKNLSNEVEKNKELQKYMEANPFFNISMANALAIALFALSKSMSVTKFEDIFKKVAVDVILFQLGMQNADNAEKLRVIESQKEMIKAVTSFTQAAVSAYQLYGTMSAQAAAQRKTDEKWQVKKADGSPKLGDDGKPLDMITEQKTKIKQFLEGKAADMNAPEANLSQTEKDWLRTEKQNLFSMETRKAEEFQNNYRNEIQIAQMKGEIPKNLVDGFSQLTSSSFTLKSGELEKMKAQIDTIIQTMNKASDSMKGDFATQNVRFLDWLAEQLSGFNRAFTPAQRG